MVGPVLFSLIIFDLQDYKRNVQSQVENEEKNDGTEQNNIETDAMVLKYAEDSKCFLAILDKNRALSQTIIHNKLLDIMEWANKNHMIFNAQKFAHLTFKIETATAADNKLKLFEELPFSQVQATEYSTNKGLIIKKSECERDLGTYVSPNLRWNTNIHHLRSKTWKKSE